MFITEGCSRLCIELVQSRRLDLNEGNLKNPKIYIHFIFYIHHGMYWYRVYIYRIFKYPRAVIIGVYKLTIHTWEF